VAVDARDGRDGLRQLSLVGAATQSPQQCVPRTRRPGRMSLLSRRGRIARNGLAQFLASAGMTTIAFGVHALAALGPVLHPAHHLSAVRRVS
jgi:hypothetical protein